MQKRFHITISEDLLEHKLQPVSEIIGHHICKQNAICALKAFKSFYKSNLKLFLQLLCILL